MHVGNTRGLLHYIRRRLTLRLLNISIKRFIFLGIFVSAFAAALPLLDYIRQDTAVSDPTELYLLIFFFVGTALFLLASYCLWLRTPVERLIATMLSTYILGVIGADFANKNHFLQAHAGSKGAIAIVEIGGYFLAGFIAFGSGQLEKYIDKKKWTSPRPLETIAKFVCVALLVVNGLKFFQYTSKQWAASTYQPVTSVHPNLSRANSKPKRDIYYFVFDRYASQESLQKHFNFDNSSFVTALQQEGFTIRDNAYANYQYTAPSIASTVRMDYHSDIAKALPGERPGNFLPYKKIIERSPVSQNLRQAGYRVYNVGNWWNVTRKQQQATNILPQYQLTLFGKHILLSELQSQVIGRSFFGILLKYIPEIAGKTIFSFRFDTPRELYLGQLAEIKQLARQPHNSPRFVFGHFLNAHPPYSFMPDGSAPPYSGNDNSDGAPRSVKYIDQLQYANTTALDLIRTIKAQSKVPPIIIIQSDEGPYPLPLPADWTTVPAYTLQLKTGILAAYYLPDTSSEQIAPITSSVNAFRFVFNHYFGAQLPYLPDCTYIYNDKKPFTFYNVTAQLHTHPQPIALLAKVSCEKLLQPLLSFSSLVIGFA